MTQTSQQRFLGATGLEVSALGVGTNRWGARRGRKNSEILRTFQTSLDAGLTFFDTAEVYNRGESERLLGECVNRDKRPVVLASKFAPLPGRLSPHALMDALDASLSRLNAETIDLYYVHWPTVVLRIDALMDMMALAVRIGRIRAVGVSNYNARQMRQAAARLARYGIPLAANEVHYSLLHRQPETNGVLEACQELNVALVAYQPLESGLLKTPETPVQTEHTEEPPTPGRFERLPRPGKARQEQIARLHKALGEIARGRGKTVSQVALNWLLRKDDLVIPIPGSTSADHIAENVETLNWRLSDDEFAALDMASQFAKK